MLARTVIDFQTALSILVGIVKDFGAEHSAPGGLAGCTYFVQDNKPNGWGEPDRYIDPLNLRPVCIVGQAFHRLGIMRALLSGNDQFSTCQPDALLWSNAETMGVEFTEEARLLFRNAQYRQDNDETWRDAVNGAVEDVREHAVSSFKSKSDLFDLSVDAETSEMPEPLAELLNA